jgi:hypothetical protein
MLVDNVPLLVSPFVFLHLSPLSLAAAPRQLTAQTGLKLKVDDSLRRGVALAIMSVSGVFEAKSLPSRSGPTAAGIAAH